MDDGESRYRNVFTKRVLDEIHISDTPISYVKIQRGTPPLRLPPSAYAHDYDLINNSKIER